MFYLSGGRARSKPLGGIYGGEVARPPTWHRRRKECAALLEKLLSRHSAIWGWRPPCDCWAHTRRAVLDEGPPLVQQSQASMAQQSQGRCHPQIAHRRDERIFQGMIGTRRGVILSILRIQLYYLRITAPKLPHATRDALFVGRSCPIQTAWRAPLVQHSQASMSQQSQGRRHPKLHIAVAKEISKACLELDAG